MTKGYPLRIALCCNQQTNKQTNLLGTFEVFTRLLIYLYLSVKSQYEFCTSIPFVSNEDLNLSFRFADVLTFTLITQFLILQM